MTLIFRPVRIRGGLSWAPTAATQGWSGGLQGPSLGLSYFWGSGMLTPVCLECAVRKQRVEKNGVQGTECGFVGSNLA